MKDSYIITKFVAQFHGAASIRALNEDKVLYANNSYMTMAHQALSFKDAMLSSSSKSEYHSILFCEFVESEFKKTNQPTFALEFYDGFYASTVRLLIKYYNRPAILTLICGCASLPNNTENDIYTCQISKYINKKNDSIISAPYLEEKNKLITSFVDNFYGDAVIYDINGNVMYGDESSNMSTHVPCLNCISNTFRENYQSTFAIERTEAKTYISLCVLITFKNEPAELKLSTLLNVCPELDDDIYQCDVNGLICISD